MSSQVASLGHLTADLGIETRIKKLRIAKGLTLGELAKKLEVSSSYLSRIESKGRRMNSELLRKLCCALECSPIDILDSMDYTKQGTNANTGTVPVYSLIACDDIVQLQPDITIDWIAKLPEMHNKQSFATYIIDNDNAPKYRVGDLIYAQEAERLVLGRPVIVVLHDHTAILGELVSIDKSSISISSFDSTIHGKYRFREIMHTYDIIASKESFLLK